MAKNSKKDNDKVIDDNTKLDKTEVKETINKDFKHKSHDKPETKEEIAAAKAKLQAFKDNQKVMKKQTKEHSKAILDGQIVSMTSNTPDVKTNVIELFDVKKSYLTGDLEYEVLKGVNLKIK